MAVLREIEATDHGALSDHLGVVWYRARSDLYNQTVQVQLDESARQVSTPKSPVSDDQRARNQTQASDSSGHEYVWTDEDDVARRGLYSWSLSVNVAQPGQLVHHAQWATAMGVTRERRWPTATINLYSNPTLVAAWLGMLVGSRLRIVNPLRPTSQTEIDLVVRGWTQNWVGPREWTVTLNAVPARPYEVYAVGLGRLDCTAELDVGVDADETILSVATTTGPLLSTNASDYPVACELAGERVIVTAVTGTSSPQTVTVTRADNGVAKSHADGTAFGLWRPGLIAL
jgi:hypothetical protein